MKSKKMRMLISFMLVLMVLMTVPVYADGHNPERAKKIELYKKFAAGERTDPYALSYFSNTTNLDWGTDKDWDTEQYRAAQEIIKGIDDDYEKAKAIYEWGRKNITYVYTTSEAQKLKAQGVPGWRVGNCEAFASAGVALFRAAGFPTKKVYGDLLGGPSSRSTAHVWNRVFIDGKWRHVDLTPSFGIYFDMSIEDQAPHYLYAGVPDTDWWGEIEFVTPGGALLKKVQGPELYGPFTDNYGYDFSLWYNHFSEHHLDEKLAKLDVKNDVFDAFYRRVVIPEFEVKFLYSDFPNVQAYMVGKGRDGYNQSWIDAEIGSKLPAIPEPKKDGYTFMGWKKRGTDDSQIWDLTKLTVNESMTFTAVFAKGKVAKPKPVLPKVDNTETKPKKETPKAHLNAIPTASTVLVNGVSTEFEAYNINNNNYFKLRDLAQAVNNTEKNFEVEWDGSKNAINLVSNKVYTPAGGELAKGDNKAKNATPTTSAIYKDGKEIKLTAYNINGNNFFKLRDIAEAFNIGITWDGATSTIGIDTSIDYVAE